MPETTEPKSTSEGICVKCRARLSLAHFQINAAKDHSAWCSACREACAKKWGIDEDLVELTYALYVFEKSLEVEATAVMVAKVQLLEKDHQDLADLRTKMHHHHMIRRTRIPDRLRRFLGEYREDFYYAIDMVMPRVEIPIGSGD